MAVPPSGRFSRSPATRSSLRFRPLPPPSRRAAAARGALTTGRPRHLRDTLAPATARQPSRASAMCHLPRDTTARPPRPRVPRAPARVHATYVHNTTHRMHTARNRPVPRRALIACHHLGRDPACHRPPPDCGVWSSPSPPPRLRTPHTTLRARMPSPPQRIMCAHTRDLQGRARAHHHASSARPTLGQTLESSTTPEMEVPAGKGPQ